MDTLERVYSNKSIIEIEPSTTKKGLGDLPLLNLFIDDKFQGAFGTYTECCENLISLTRKDQP